MLSGVPCTCRKTSCREYIVSVNVLYIYEKVCCLWMPYICLEESAEEIASILTSIRDCLVSVKPLKLSSIWKTTFYISASHLSRKSQAQ